LPLHKVKDSLNKLLFIRRKKRQRINKLMRFILISDLVVQKMQL